MDSSFVESGGEGLHAGELRLDSSSAESGGEGCPVVLWLVEGGPFAGVAGEIQPRTTGVAAWPLDAGGGGGERRRGGDV